MTWASCLVHTPLSFSLHLSLLCLAVFSQLLKCSSGSCFFKVWFVAGLWCWVEQREVYLNNLRYCGALDCRVVSHGFFISPLGQTSSYEQKRFQEHSSPANSFYPGLSSVYIPSAPWLECTTCISYFLLCLLNSPSLFPHPFVPSQWAELSLFWPFHFGPAFHSLLLLAPVHVNPRSGKLWIDCLAWWWVPDLPSVDDSQAFWGIWSKPIFTSHVRWPDVVPAYAEVHHTGVTLNLAWTPWTAEALPSQ